MLNFKIQREALLKPLRAVAGVVERRQSHSSPILSHVLLQVDERKIQLTTTDQEVELIGSTEQGLEVFNTGYIAVPFRKLMDICRVLPEGSILSIQQEQERVLLRAGRSRFNLSLLPADTFPKVEESIPTCELSLSKRSLRFLIEQTMFSMAEQDVRYYLNGMLFEVTQDHLHTVAADGHRLALCAQPIDMPNVNTMRVILPRKGVLELNRILEDNDDMVTMTVGVNHARVQMQDTVLTTKLLEGRFPEYERLIPRGNDKVIVAGREKLKEAFLRAGALLSDKVRGIQLRLSPGVLNLRAINSEYDEVEEDVEVAYEGESLEIGFNVRYLIDVLNTLTCQEVKLSFLCPNSSLLIEGVQEAACRYVVMPMRL